MTESTQPEITKRTVAEELAELLCKVEGVGEVDVLLTLSAGEKTIYQTDEDKSDSTTQITTVTISGAQNEDIGLVKQIIPPIYEGAIILCQGADNPQICLQLVNAVSKVTGLGADKISVLKMK